MRAADIGLTFLAGSVATYLAMAPLTRQARADDYDVAPVVVPTVTVALLPTAVSVGAQAYVTDCRALVLGAALAIEPAGQGTGCLATWSGQGWRVAGTAVPVQN